MFGMSFCVYINLFGEEYVVVFEVVMMWGVVGFYVWKSVDKKVICVDVKIE